MSLQPTIKANHYMISAGHYLATEAGYKILEAGGNAFDAGVAAGIALGVVQPDLVQVAGVAPIILYHAESGEVVTVSGLGWWPKATNLETYIDNYGGKIPVGLARAVVPAAPDAWIKVLAKYGTMSFGDVATSAMRYARDGFSIHPLLAENIDTHQDRYQSWPASAEVFLPEGRPLKTGELVVQRDLGRSLQYMIDEEKAAAGRGRDAALEAARAAFYKGDIAKTITDYHAANGGMLSMEDMAEYASAFEAPVGRTYTGFGEPIDVYGCGPWCQGPTMLEMMSIIEGVDLKGMGYNSSDYVHFLTEAMKLAFADREAYIGDPRFVDVPVDTLLSVEYGRQRRSEIDMAKACPEMPAPGRIPGVGAGPAATSAAAAPSRMALDTSYVAVVDEAGNIFSATPSDGSYGMPIIPGTGMAPSSRGSQNWAVEGHPSAIAPGKRPRLTPSPALAMRDGKLSLPFGTPGGDVQAQAMLQVFLNMEVWGMEAQDAIEAPRFSTFSFPNSFEPHGYEKNILRMEGRMDESVMNEMDARGHKVERWPDMTWKAGSVCAIQSDLETGIMTGGADARRASRVMGW
jgi:gamma-glutamyltranspeptidase / glutathione hydrolase